MHVHVTIWFAYFTGHWLLWHCVLNVPLSVLDKYSTIKLYPHPLFIFEL